MYHLLTDLLALVPCLLAWLARHEGVQALCITSCMCRRPFVVAQHVGLAHMYAALHECVGPSEVFLFHVQTDFITILYCSGTFLVQHRSLLLRSMKGCRPGLVV